MESYIEMYIGACITVSQGTFLLKYCQKSLSSDHVPVYLKIQAGWPVRPPILVLDVPPSK